MELVGHLLQSNRLVVGLNIVHHGYQAFILAGIVILNFWQLVDADAQSVNGSLDNVLVNADAPVGSALTCNIDIRNCFGGRTSRESVFLIGRQLITDAKKLFDGITQNKIRL